MPWEAFDIIYVNSFKERIMKFLPPRSPNILEASPRIKSQFASQAPQPCNAIWSYIYCEVISYYKFVLICNPNKWVASRINFTNKAKDAIQRIAMHTTFIVINILEVFDDKDHISIKQGETKTYLMYSMSTTLSIHKPTRSSTSAHAPNIQNHIPVTASITMKIRV